MNFIDTYTPTVDPVWNKPPFWEPRTIKPATYENGRRSTKVDATEDRKSRYSELLKSGRMTLTACEVLDCVKAGARTRREILAKLTHRSNDAVASAIKICLHKWLIKSDGPGPGRPATYTPIDQ